MLFFVISGFVVSRSMDAGQWQGGAFLIKRAFRLIPVLTIYIVAASASLHFFSGVHGWPLGPVKESEILVQSAIGLLGAQSITIMMGLNPPANMGHLWSLSVEDIFYTSLALGVFVIAIFSKDTKRTLGIYSLILAILLILLRLFWTITGLIGISFPIHVRGHPGLEVLYCSSDYLSHWRAEFLLLGVSLYCLATRRLRFRGESILALVLLSIPFGVELFRRGSDSYYQLLTIRVQFGVLRRTYLAC